jgi:hypothetical protein
VTTVVELIGVEEHFLTAEVREAWSAIGPEASDPGGALKTMPPTAPNPRSFRVAPS